MNSYSQSQVSSSLPSLVEGVIVFTRELPASPVFSPGSPGLLTGFRSEGGEG